MPNIIGELSVVPDAAILVARERWRGVIFDYREVGLANRLEYVNVMGWLRTRSNGFEPPLLDNYNFTGLVHVVETIPEWIRRVPYFVREADRHNQRFMTNEYAAMLADARLPQEDPYSYIWRQTMEKIIRSVRDPNLWYTPRRIRGGYRGGYDHDIQSYAQFLYNCFRHLMRVGAVAFGSLGHDMAETRIWRRGV